MLQELWTGAERRILNSSLPLLFPALNGAEQWKKSSLAARAAAALGPVGAAASSTFGCAQCGQIVQLPLHPSSPSAVLDSALLPGF